MALIPDAGPDHITRSVVVEGDTVAIHWSADGEVVPIGRGRLARMERYTKDGAAWPSRPTPAQPEHLVDSPALVQDAHTMAAAILEIACMYEEFVRTGEVGMRVTDAEVMRLRAEALTWARETLMLLTDDEANAPSGRGRSFLFDTFKARLETDPGFDDGR